MPSFPPPTTYRPPAPSSGDAGAPEPGSRVVRVGAVIGAGVVAASLASVPGALRVAPAVPAEGLVNVWLALVACALVPAIACVVILRAAREGLRAFGGPGASATALGFVAWATAT